MTATAWEPYRPTPAAPWDLGRVAHLHRRAGFAASWSELQRDLRDGPRAALARLLSARARGGGGRPGRAGAPGPGTAPTSSAPRGFSACCTAPTRWASGWP